VDLTTARRRHAELWRRFGGAQQASLEPALLEWYAPEVLWHCCQPFNALRGVATVLREFWLPFVTAFPDFERRDDIRVCGQFRGGDWLACTGHYVATFARDFIGIRASGGAVTIRYGEYSRFENGRVVEVFVIFDWLDLLRQVGQWPSNMPLGGATHDRVPGPATLDGCLLEGASAAEGARSMALVEAMIAGLMQYDGKSLASMGMKRFWHPNFMWYGPAGIGTARGLGGFERYHQGPFLRAFPDRVGGDHKCRIAEGAYVASTGWPSIRATHCAPYLGAPATQQRITMRVMDFWRRADDLLVENWVFIDLPDLLAQMGRRVLPQAS
jgi:predicted ester cyclase